MRKKRMPSVVNVDKLSLKDLNDLEAKVAKAKANARNKAKGDVKAKIDAILASSGFTIADLYPVARAVRGRGTNKAAKFVNPDNRSETWTGRGRKPNWLVAKLGKGAKLQDFAV
ncbi:MAG: H-NS histone family protein [Hyphomicrobiaceae bacterium]|nr:H-NS histone family protein [Hyphomicrobiaceae bacterium]